MIKKMSVLLGVCLLVGSMASAMECESAQENFELDPCHASCALLLEMSDLAAGNEGYAGVVIDKGLLNAHPYLADLVQPHYGRELVTDITKLRNVELRALADALGRFRQCRIKLVSCYEPMETDGDSGDDYLDS